MDTAATEVPIVRLLLELDPAPEGRLEGRISTEAALCAAPFSGVLELLKVLEETLAAVRRATHSASEGTNP